MKVRIDDLPTLAEINRDYPGELNADQTNAYEELRLFQIVNRTREDDIGVEVFERRLNPESIDALRTIFPDLFANIAPNSYVTLNLVLKAQWGFVKDS